MTYNIKDKNMEKEPSENEAEQPIINFKSTDGLQDYFCPFCGHKLFRGKVSEFNMVCSNCNKLVRSQENNTTQKEVQS